MPNSVQTYVMHDSDPEQKGCTRINRRDATEWNKKGFGIFHTVNCFFLDRKKKNLQGINAWAIDIDTGTKPEQMAKIKKGLMPTLVIEVKRGYHVYWKAKEADENSWKAIVWDRLVPFYGADPNAKDLSRILRVPGFHHLKDPSDPFLVKKVFGTIVEYSPWEMLSAYKDPKKEKKELKVFNKGKRAAPMPGSFWDNVWNLNCEEALYRLSGTEYVGTETFSFRQNASGTKNILSNNKGTSCWIDKDKRIGSYDMGGPSIAQWLFWYHKDYTKVVSILKEVFPELESSVQGSLL